MKFDSKAGQELRTWILFFVGIALAIIFAFKNNPLSPWWTLVIGAFTCTAIIVSAVQAVAGGMSDAAKKAIQEESHGNGERMDPETKDASSFSTTVGNCGAGLIFGFCRSYSAPI